MFQPTLNPMRILTILCCVFIVNFVFSQQSSIPVLEREISFRADNKPAEEVLSEIASRADLVFSYNPDLIRNMSNVNLNVTGKPVRYALNIVFKDKDIQFKAKGKYVILTKEKPTKETRVFEGYVFDSQTGEKLTEASVYDKRLLASAITDKYGYFSMEVPTNEPVGALQISKIGYTDTMLITLDSALKSRNIEVNLKQKDTLSIINRIADFKKFKPGWLVPEKLKINARNISNPVFRSIQLSLIPYLSTNKLLGGAVINDVSINATVGYVQGIRAFEAGGLLNFVRTDVSGFQAAGLGNVLGGNLTGFQAAGLFNIEKDVKGFQAAGLFNQAGMVYGTQVAGLYNLAGDTAVIQIAGLFNKTKQNSIQIAGLYNTSFRSNVQISGLLNTTHKTELQISGLVNTADTLTGGQIAGLANLSLDKSGFQLAGAFNNSKDEAAVQISGILNKTRYLKGFQLGVVNIADTSSGVSLGLFSFIKKGYHKLEISADESFPVNLAFRSGTKQFHTILMVGSTFRYSYNTYGNVGLGLGTSFGKTGKLQYDLDFTSQEVINQRTMNWNFHLYKIYFGIEKPFTRKFSIASGLSLNALMADNSGGDYTNLVNRIPFYTLYSRSYPSGENLKVWIGAKVALRFF